MTAVYAHGGGLGTPHYARWDRRESVESGCQAERSKDEEDGQPRQLTPFEKLMQDMSQDEKVLREITLGKRIGFYRIRGEIGSGNFSQVKLGIHSLTKGRICPSRILSPGTGSSSGAGARRPGPGQRLKGHHRGPEGRKCCPLTPPIISSVDFHRNTVRSVFLFPFTDRETEIKRS